ncbi:MAG TPA: hypothetical protein VEI83_09465, partial [Acidimicrobiales bacterium]|nr:hypothetical protein [Acidimicrobiales bacterium]
LAIAIPTFLGVTGSANDRAAQSNLTNGLTEVKALYQNSQSYNTTALPSATLTSSAPEFSWQQSAACAANAGGNCMSEYPVDISGPDDGNGVILAAFSKNQATCWYVVDLEAAPTSTSFGADASPGTVQFTGGTGAGLQEENGVAASQAGVYYAKSPGNQASCNATTPTTFGSAWNWGTSYSNAPVN